MTPKQKHLAQSLESGIFQMLNASLAEDKILSVQGSQQQVLVEPEYFPEVTCNDKGFTLVVESNLFEGLAPHERIAKIKDILKKSIRKEILDMIVKIEAYTSEEMKKKSSILT